MISRDSMSSTATRMSHQNSTYAVYDPTQHANAHAPGRTQNCPRSPSCAQAISNDKASRPSKPVIHNPRHSTPPTPSIGPRTPTSLLYAESNWAVMLVAGSRYSAGTEADFALGLALGAPNAVVYGGSKHWKLKALTTIVPRDLSLYRESVPLSFCDISLSYTLARLPVFNEREES